MKYEIVGDTLPVVICHLNKGEKMKKYTKKLLTKFFCPDI